MIETHSALPRPSHPIGEMGDKWIFNTVPRVYNRQWDTGVGVIKTKCDECGGCYNQCGQRKLLWGGGMAGVSKIAELINLLMSLGHTWNTLGHEVTENNLIDILNKFRILCWAVFITILGCMWPMGHRLDTPGLECERKWRKKFGCGGKVCTVEGVASTAAEERACHVQDHWRDEMALRMEGTTVKRGWNTG